jgi:uncharacterized protein
MSRHGINVVYCSDMMPQLESPYLICGFPGSGYVGKIAIDHLLQELKATRLADIYSTSFPPQVVIGTDGVVNLMKNTIFYSKASTSTSNNDVLLLTGDSQPTNPDSEYLLAEEILDIAAKFSAKRVFTMAAYVTEVFVDRPRVFGTATNLEIIKGFNEKDIITMDSGSVAGMNGLVIGAAKLRGMEGTCLLGETSGYVVDAKASKSILERLVSILGIMIDLSTIEKKAKETDMLIKAIQQQASGKVGENQQPGMSRKTSNTGYIS